MGKNIDNSALVGAYPACGTCGGRRVRCEAWAAWDLTTRLWQVVETFDGAYCLDCEAACGVAWQVDNEFRVRRIRRLNDLVRHGDLCHATVVVTEGVRAWGETFLEKVAQAVIAFDKFSEDNDPHGEHDFGAVEVGDQKIFWKIDYFDLALSMHSPDPANRDVTHRVLTIMLASEY